MKDLQIAQIIERSAFPDLPDKAELIETHISWVILTSNFAYKIKKPLQYTFLDFSTLAKRKFYCEQELKLNKRLTQGMYLAVVPIRKAGGEIAIEGTNGEVIGYAVKMKRMDNTRQMNFLLEKNEVTHTHMHQLAEQLAEFHRCAKRVHSAPDIEFMHADFADILNVEEFVGKKFGPAAAQKIREAVVYSDRFLHAHADRLLERHHHGFNIDGHGDLHAKNILLLDEPVVFDCIEFSDHYRQGDVLSELAFFCMDLDVFARADLADVFLEKYLVKNPCIETEEDQHIFNYFKIYRANVRLKVYALKAMQTEDDGERKMRLRLIGEYIKLLGKYLDEVPSAYLVPQAV